MQWMFGWTLLQKKHSQFRSEVYTVIKALEGERIYQKKPLFMYDALVGPEVDNTAIEAAVSKLKTMLKPHGNEKDDVVLLRKLIESLVMNAEQSVCEKGKKFIGNMLLSVFSGDLVGAFSGYNPCTQFNKEMIT